MPILAPWSFDRLHPRPERVHTELACDPYIPSSADPRRSSAPCCRLIFERTVNSSATVSQIPATSAQIPVCLHLGRSVVGGRGMIAAEMGQIVDLIVGREDRWTSSASSANSASMISMRPAQDDNLPLAHRRRRTERRDRPGLLLVGRVGPVELAQNRLAAVRAASQRPAGCPVSRVLPLLPRREIAQSGLGHALGFFRFA